MLRKKLLLLSVPVCVYMLFSINACRKTDRDDDTETQSSVDYSVAQQLVNDVFKQVVYYSDTNSVLKLASTLTCDTSWIANAFFPKKLTIKFDTINGCIDALGVHHKGKINAVLTKNFSDSLAVTTVTFDEYYINGYKMTGTQTITCNGTVGGNRSFSITVSNALITIPTGKTITLNAQLTSALIAGRATDTFTDDVLSITGTANGIATKGENFTCKINTALRFELACKYITGGTFTINPGNLTPRTVDFGPDLCDNAITVNLTGKSFAITLP